MYYPLTLIALIISSCSGYYPAADSDTVSSDNNPPTMKLSSSAFDHEGLIPSLYTCDGDNISPPLSVADIPTDAKSLTLIVTDPDVPKELRPDGLWVHWVVWNIAPSLADISPSADPKALGIPWANTRGNLSYGGPCPPDREHRYFFDLYALDTQLDLPEGSTKDEVEKAMNGHIIQKTTLMGRYERIKR